MPKNIFNFEDEENAELKALAKNSVCFLPISIGQKYHTGEDWCETIKQMNEYFSACIIIPVDGLHRFTEMMKDKTLEVEGAETIAFEAGTKWLNEVENFNKKLSIPHAISRWSEWTSTEKFLSSNQKVVENYDNEDSDFRAQVDLLKLKFVAGFAENKLGHDKVDEKIKFNLNKWLELCKLYLLEELAFVDMLKNRGVSQKVLNFFDDHHKLKLIDQPFFMAYPFGEKSKNKAVYNCFESLCSDKLLLINLSEPSNKKNKTNKKTNKKIFKNQTFFASEKVTDISSLLVSTAEASQDRIKIDFRLFSRSGSGSQENTSGDVSTQSSITNVDIFNLDFDTDENATEQKENSLSHNRDSMKKLC
jgi:hypothetical protein